MDNDSQAPTNQSVPPTFSVPANGVRKPGSTEGGKKRMGLISSFGFFGFGGWGCLLFLVF